jgi:hypothetical protein
MEVVVVYEGKHIKEIHFVYSASLFCLPFYLLIKKKKKKANQLKKKQKVKIEKRNLNTVQTSYE